MTTSPTITHDFDAGEERRREPLPLPGFLRDLRAGRYPAVPETVAAAVAARDNLEKARQAVYSGSRDTDALADQLLAALRDGDDLAAALGAAVDGDLDRQRRDAAFGIIRIALARSDRFLRDTITDALPEIFAGLRPVFEKNVDQLRKAYADAGDLDIHQPDPLLVAQATAKQQRALITIAEETRTYRRIRTAQTNALRASSLPVPGYHPHRVTWTWDGFFETGLHEVSDPDPRGLPGKDDAPRRAVHAVVTRQDVWLPDPDELAEAFDRLEAVKAEWALQSAAPEPPAQDAPTYSALASSSIAFLDATSRNNGAGHR
jgi:hypothetical protein